MRPYPGVPLSFLRAPKLPRFEKLKNFKFYCNLISVTLTNNKLNIEV
jgi:hypothetical protein